MPNQIPDIYKAAIRRYEEITKTKLDDPSIARLATLDDLTKAIEAKNKEFTAFRAKRHGIFAALSVAMRPIELVGDLAAGGASMAFPPSSLVFGAVSSLINAAKDVSANYDAIMDLLDTLKDFTVRLEVYNREKISKSLSDKLADILVTLIDIFALSRKEIKDGRLFYFAKNVFLGNDVKIQDAVAKLAKLTESEDRLVGAETLTEVKKSGCTLDGVSMTVTSTGFAVNQMSGDISKVSIDVSRLTQRFDALMVASHESTAEVRETNGRSHQRHIKEVLQPSVSALDWYDKINRTRIANTGNWIREETFFRSWMNKEMPVLWIAGNPGAGKSYIASNIISFLREQYPQGVHHTSNVSVAYFFFKDDHPDTRSFDQALRDIAYQMSQNDPAYAKYIASTCDSAQEIKSLPSLWRTIFVKYFLENKDVDSSAYLLLDGIDESDPDSREQFFELAKDLQEASDARIQIVMLGRPQLIDEFEMTADMTQVPTIYVTARNNSDDIVHYIESSIKKSAYLKRAPKALQAEIVEKLSSGAQGMFIWVNFMLKDLLKKQNEHAIRTALNKAPRGLDKMIRHVLEGYSISLKDNVEAAEDLNTLLAWVTCAQRPLKLDELDTLLKVKSPTGDGNWWLEGTLRKQFASFFMLTRVDGLTTADLQRTKTLRDDFEVDLDDEISTDAFDDVENDTNFDSDPATTEVTFCHASIGDFFRKESETKAIAGEDCPSIGLEYHDSKVSVLKTCLEVLCSKPSSDTWTRAAKLLPFIRSFWIPILDTVDVAKTSTNDKIFIGTAIVKVLSDAQILLNVVGDLKQEQFCQENVDLFEKWVTDSEIFKALPKENQDWVQSTSQNRAELVLPYAKYVAEQWLRGLSTDAKVFAAIIYAYISLCKKDPNWNLNTPEKIMEAAEWCNFEQNALWHRRLAMALREHEQWDAAIPHFQKALDLDPSMWLARVGEALSYMKRATKEAYRKAIELHKITLDVLEKTQPDDTLIGAGIQIYRHISLERLAFCLRSLDEQHAALETLERAFIDYNRCNKCVCAQLDLYSRAGRHEDIMKLLNGLNEPIKGLDYTRLSESLLTEANYKAEAYFEIISEAALKMNEIPFTFEIYRNAIAAARKQYKSVQAAHLELCLATLYDRYGYDSERAASMWERIVDTYRSTKAETEIAEVKWAASINLARHCLKQTVEVGKDTSEAERCGAILERLAKVKTGSQTTITASESTTMLGAWYKLVGRDEEARACFQVQVRECIRMLSDDDPTNDEDAYWKLIFVLAAAGDDKNINALFWEVFNVDQNDGSDKAVEEGSSKSNDRVDETPGKHVEQSQFEDTDRDDVRDKVSDSVPEDNKFVANMTCDGCFQGILPGNIAICRYCFNIAICRDCFVLLKAGELPVNICSPKHAWFFVERISKEVRKARALDKLFIDGEHLSMDEWKKKLVVQWNI
ncbi:NACHT and TPR domain protein [Melanomma pulvis-pyrius CBS 109.77]|uniref:NACHT and TPR domain protein n=1 Tax=Melanomma pulvis-pyrius CBS 109.77 TaxID=1314802 RepID=A0A6A6XES6_9PLEO|nr:NACHT and TPR domain protein [Melanomma pulvis-pyrius CBS 109.77]